MGAIGQLAIPRLIIDLVEVYARAEEHHLERLVVILHRMRGDEVIYVLSGTRLPRR